MPKLTKAQERVYKLSQKPGREIYFRRFLKSGKEQCFIGKIRVDPRVWFFFFEIGYFKLAGQSQGKKYDYYFMCLSLYKLEEYIDNQPAREPGNKK